MRFHAMRYLRKESLRGWKDVVRQYNKYAPHAEHVGFVAYAGVEVTGFHWILGIISAYLLITGIWVMFGGSD